MTCNPGVLILIFYMRRITKNWILFSSKPFNSCVAQKYKNAVLDSFGQPWTFLSMLAIDFSTNPTLKNYTLIDLEMWPKSRLWNELGPSESSASYTTPLNSSSRPQERFNLLFGTVQKVATVRGRYAGQIERARVKICGITCLEGILRQSSLVVSNERFFSVGDEHQKIGILDLIK